MRKLIFLDIDGTIVTPGKAPAKETVEAIRAARKNGHLIFLSTGRASCNIETAISQIGFDGMILHAGGRVLVGDNEIVNHPLPPMRAKEIIDILKEVDMTYTLETKDGQFSQWSTQPEPEFDPTKASSELLRQLLQRRRSNSKPMSGYHNEPVYKVSLLSLDPKQRPLVANRMPEWAKLVWFDGMIPGGQVAAGEISDKKVSKATAMKEICRYFSASAKDCIAFGDSMNDAEIIAAAGIGVAMGNSEDQLKRLSDRVCETCDEVGVAKELKRLSLI